MTRPEETHHNVILPCIASARAQLQVACDAARSFRHDGARCVVWHGRMLERLQHPDRAVPVNGAVVFMIWPAPWLGRHLSWGLFVVSILLILGSLGCLLRTALMNPGFLPRVALDEDEEYGYAAHAPARIEAPHARPVGPCECRNALCSPTWNRRHAGSLGCSSTLSAVG